MEFLKKYIDQLVTDGAYSKSHTLNPRLHCVSITVFFIIMKNLSNQMSNDRSFGKINTMELNAAIC